MEEEMVYSCGYKKNDEVCVVVWDDDTHARLEEGIVIGDVSYRYDSPVLAIHLDTMEDKKDWVEIDIGYIGHTKAEVLDKLRTYINVLQELYNKEI